MAVYIVRRLLYAILTFFGITIATFVLIHAVPGDPTTFYLMNIRNVSPDVIAAIRHEQHLDEPLPVQYVYWLHDAATLEFGRSVIDRRPVRERIFEKLPNTVELNLIAFLVAVGIGLPVGLWSAERSGRTAERISAVTFFLLYSLPAFWVALLLMQFFAVRHDLLPLFGMASEDADLLSPAGRFVDHVRHLILPVITLSFAQIAIFVRFSKSAVTEVIRQDYITTARAKGVSPPLVLWRHAFRNALIPLVTLLGLTVPGLLSGSVIVEQMFEWDGIGRLYLQSILRRDYPTVMALTVATSVVTLLVSLAADILYAVADPRIRLAERT
ncbi:MAG: ABC transporter permease [Thermoanaerobaculia bacterium]